MRKKLNAFAQAARSPSWLAFVWFGLTAGVSLLAAPLDFTAPASHPISLGVGEVVHGALNQVELALLIAMLVLIRMSSNTTQYWPHAALLVLIMIAQSAWLLPELIARSASAPGGAEPASFLHTAFAVSELLKLATLVALGFQARAR
ncbi:MAG: hypothetical protein AAF417_19795 [Pseudomonadota bacterium]